MGSINGYNDIVADWRRLLGVWRNHAELLSAASEERDLLAQALSDAERLKAIQDQLRGERQLATQQLNAVLTQGKELAIRMRSLARSKIRSQERAARPVPHSADPQAQGPPRGGRRDRRDPAASGGKHVSRPFLLECLFSLGIYLRWPGRARCSAPMASHAAV